MDTNDDTLNQWQVKVALGSLMPAGGLDRLIASEELPVVRCPQCDTLLFRRVDVDALKARLFIQANSWYAAMGARAPDVDEE